MAATSFEHRGPQCLLTLGRSTSPSLDQFPVRVCSCPLCIINRLCVHTHIFAQTLFSRICGVRACTTPGGVTTERSYI